MPCCCLIVFLLFEVTVPASRHSIPSTYTIAMSFWKRLFLNDGLTYLKATCCLHFFNEGRRFWFHSLLNALLTSAQEMMQPGVHSEVIAALWVIDPIASKTGRQVQLWWKMKLCCCFVTMHDDGYHCTNHHWFINPPTKLQRKLIKKEKH